MGDFLDFPEIYQEVRGVMNSGRLKLQSNMVVFKNLKTGRVDQIQASDVESTKWMPRAYGQCLKLILSSGTVHKYDGFRENDYEKVSMFMKKCYQKDLEKVDMSVRGWNFGNTNFVGNSLEFEVHNKEAFEIPLNNVSHTTTSKNEVTLEFHQNDDAAVSLVEMRFHIPTAPDAENDPVEEFYDRIQQKADIIQAVGESIVNINEVHCLTPRGRYDIKLYPTFLQLHGKTFDYKIPFSTVIRLFLLPHKDGRQVFFVLSVDPPITQGMTRYPFLIILFNKDDEMTVELSLTDEEIAEKYDNKLSKEMSGLEFEIVSKLMKSLTGKKITVPGVYRSHHDCQSVMCSYKASNGFLYPLERGFIYVHKPPVYIRFDEVACVNFARSSGSTRSFDFDVETRAGTVYNFSNIEKEEYTKLFDFVKSKRLGVKNIGNKSTVNVMDDMLGSDDEDKHDAYLERMKQEGRAAESDEDSEESSSTDDDFVPNENVSDVAEEFDSDAKATSDEDDENKKPKKKKEKRPAKQAVREQKVSRKAKKEKKDPNMPKRPQSAYFLWLNAHREQIKADNPGIGITDVSKKGGELWSKLTDKSKWEAKAKEGKAKYEEDMKEYKRNLKDSGGEVSSKKGSGRDSSRKNKPAPKSAGAKKPSGETSGAAFKSKEFISDSSDSEEEEPKKKKAKPTKQTKPVVKKEKVPPKKNKPSKKSESDEESVVGSLPSDEEILSEPTASESGSSSESEESSGSGSD